MMKPTEAVAPKMQGLTLDQVKEKITGLRPGSTVAIRIAHPWGDSLVNIRKVKVKFGECGQPDHVEFSL